MTAKSPITTHVLDISVGKPAVGIAVFLEYLEVRENEGAWQTIGQGETNSDGRVLNLLPPNQLRTGGYRLIFTTEAYFARKRVDVFFPQVVIEFVVDNTTEHYHVPLLLSPFGYSTYRGS